MGQRKLLTLRPHHHEHLVLQPLISTSLWLTLAICAVGLLAWYADRQPRTALARTLDCGDVADGRQSRAAARSAVESNVARAVAAAGRQASAGRAHRRLGQHENSRCTAKPQPIRRSGWQSPRRSTSNSPTDSIFRCELFPARRARFSRSMPSQLTSTEPNGHSTDLASAITSSLEPDRPQGEALLLLSDGIDNAGGESRVLEAAQKAKAVAAPIYTRTLGGNAGVRDLAIEAELPQDVAFVGQQVPIRARLTAQGLAGAVAKVSLVADGKTVDHQDVSLTGDRPHEVQFQAKHDRSGVYRYELQAEPMPGEATTVNNSSAYVLRVLDEPIRILLLEGKPYWDGKFLTRTLLSDPAVELTSVVRLAEGRFLQRHFQRPATESSPAVDRRPKEWRKSK